MGTDHRHETLIRETYRAPRQDPPFAMTKMVTRCPQCGTSFRITAAQLQTARGAVRCGACLHIFRAQEHLVGSSAPEAPSALVRDRKSTRLNSSHVAISYAVLCLKRKTC